MCGTRTLVLLQSIIIRSRTQSNAKRALDNIMRAVNKLQRAAIAIAIDFEL